MIGYNHIEDILEYQYIDTLLAGDEDSDLEEFETEEEDEEVL